MFPLQFGLQLAQINVRPRRDLRDQPVGPGLPLGLTRSRFFRRHLARLASLLLDAPHPRIRNLDTQRNQPPLLVRVTRGKDFAAKLRVIRFHQDHLLEMNPTYRVRPVRAMSLRRNRSSGASSL